MGWETTLTIGGNLVGIWHKHAGSAPTLLFAFDDFTTEECIKSESLALSLSTTATRALATLEANGFSWALLLADYAKSRDQSIELAMQKGWLMGVSESRSVTASFDCQALFDALDNIRPEDDLRALAETVIQECTALENSWASLALEDPDTPFRNALLFEYPAEHRPAWAAPSEDPALELRRLSLIRANDYFRRNHAAAPLVGWYLAIVLLLKHCPPEALVEFDLSGDPELDAETNLRTYCQEFWSQARGSLGETARFYGGIFGNLAAGTSNFARAAQFGRLEQMLIATHAEQDGHRKGRLLEDLLATVVEMPGANMAILEKRLRHADEELDLVLRNDLADSFWANFNSPIFIIECKNWQAKADVTELRILETKIDDRGSMCRVGVFVSLGGFTRPFLDRVRALQLKGITVFPIDGEDLSSMVRGQTLLPEWLKRNGLKRLL
ncbi:MAG TPA: restriction endonuclease [Polyangiaceae bacterium]|nr:restriction endonuclease [Polyangiaceae bacterium]